MIPTRWSVLYRWSGLGGKGGQRYMDVRAFTADGAKRRAAKKLGWFYTVVSAERGGEGERKN